MGCECVENESPDQYMVVIGFLKSEVNEDCVSGLQYLDSDAPCVETSRKASII